MFVIIVNGGLFCENLCDEKNVFNREELEKLFDKWSKGNDLVDEEDNVYEVDDLIEVGECGESVDLVNEEMCEMGDDCVSVSVVKLEGL